MEFTEQEIAALSVLVKRLAISDGEDVIGVINKYALNELCPDRGKDRVGGYPSVSAQMKAGTAVVRLATKIDLVLKDNPTWRNVH